VGQCPTWWPPCRIQVAPSVQHRKVWLTPITTVPRSNAAKMRNPLKWARVPQTSKPISAVSGPTFAILWGHVEEILHCCLTSFFRLLICALVAKIQPDKVVWWCADGEFLGPAFSVSQVRHVSDLHLKCTLRPHHVWKYNVGICYAGRP